MRYDQVGVEPASDEPGRFVNTAARARFDHIYRTLRERIVLLDYPPDTRLGEEALAQEFGVSRTPLRRVLANLESEGLVKSVHGVGTLVTDIELSELYQVYQLRMELAELIGRLSPVQPDTAALGNLRELLERCGVLETKPNIREFARLNMLLFHAITDLSANEPLREISERLYYRTTRIWLSSVSGDNLNEEIAIFRREIADVVAAAEIGDIEAIGHIRRSHISMSFTRLKKRSVR